MSISEHNVILRRSIDQIQSNKSPNMYTKTALCSRPQVMRLAHLVSVCGQRAGGLQVDRHRQLGDSSLLSLPPCCVVRGLFIYLAISVCCCCWPSCLAFRNKGDKPAAHNGVMVNSLFDYNSYVVVPWDTYRWHKLLIMVSWLILWF